MQAFIESVVGGLLMGGIYGLVALGLSMVYGIMKVINFAHGSMLALCVYLAFIVCKGLGLDPYASILLMAPFGFIVGFVVQNRLIRPLIKQAAGEVRPSSVLLLTLGLSLVLENLILMCYGPNYWLLEVPYSGSVTRIGFLPLSNVRIFAFLIATAVMLAMHLFLTRTDLGKAIRATGQNREAARLMGVDDYLVYDIAVGLGTACLGVAASCLVTFFPVFPQIGLSFMLRSFVIVVLGGIGSLAGAFVGGLIVGTIESVASQLVASSLAEVFVFAIFVAFLLFRPTGLLGLEKE